MVALTALPLHSLPARSTILFATAVICALHRNFETWHALETPSGSVTPKYLWGYAAWAPIAEEAVAVSR